MSPLTGDLLTGELRNGAVTPEASAPTAATEDRLPIDPGPERLRLSFSRVDTYGQCPLRFRFGYLDKLPTAPSPHLSWGSSIHAALETWWSSKLPEPPPLDTLLRALYDAWDDTGFAGMPRDEKLVWYRHAQEVLRRHHERFAATYQPAVACEEWFSIDLGQGVEVVGSVDQLVRTAGGGLGVVDWKTNKRAKNRGDVRGSLQLAIYAMACEELWGHAPEWVALDFVVPGVRVTVPRDEIDTGAARARVLEVAEAIRAEAFPPSPSRLCDWCDFRALCPAFEGDGPDVAGVAVVELARLRRQHARDAARIAELEALVRTRLGDDVLVDVGAGPGAR